ncbi:MAG TPA: hypothetical protein VNF47_16005 [Streptosporangiaceae bacterium]|nr:hypothetical protein [Streptosporangiaceae bacterium]
MTVTLAAGVSLAAVTPSAAAPLAGNVVRARIYLSVPAADPAHREGWFHRPD